MPPEPIWPLVLSSVPAAFWSLRLRVAKTVPALMGYGVGLMGLVGVKILAPGYYAQQDMRTPVKISITVLVLTPRPNSSATSSLVKVTPATCPQSPQS